MDMVKYDLEKIHDQMVMNGDVMYVKCRYYNSHVVNMYQLDINNDDSYTELDTPHVYHHCSFESYSSDGQCHAVIDHFEVHEETLSRIFKHINETYYDVEIDIISVDEANKRFKKDTEYMELIRGINEIKDDDDRLYDVYLLWDDDSTGYVTTEVADRYLKRRAAHALRHELLKEHKNDIMLIDVDIVESTMG